MKAHTIALLASIASPTFAAERITDFLTADGVLSIRASQANGFHEYSAYWNDTLLGETNAYIGMMGSQIYQPESNSSYVVLTAAAGGNGCADVVAIVSIKNKSAEISPAFNVCGGVKSISIEPTSDSVSISGMERDGTPITYKLSEGEISKDGRALKEDNVFFYSY